MLVYCANQSLNQNYLVISLLFQCSISLGTNYMHRRPEAKLLPLDIEIEITLRNLKKVRSAKEASMAEQREGNQNIPIVAIDRPQQR